jgi:hypothetical protein
MNLSILGRHAFGAIASGAMLAGCAANSGGTGGPPVTAFSKPATGQQTFSYTGAEQTFKVPSGVTSLNVVADGAAGAGQKLKPKAIARGGRTEATVPVTPGETLHVFVGGAGSSTGGFNGGGEPPYSGGYGGGGASDVREGGDGLTNRIVVAGAGGGGAANGSNGGKGGGTTGGMGKGHARAGGGGTQSQGGAGGYPGGYSGVLGAGGNGGLNVCYPSESKGNGGGGGGGYYGGGGGGVSAYCQSYGPAFRGGSGGGGSSYVESSATGVQMYQGWLSDTGNGVILLSW